MVTSSFTPVADGLSKSFAWGRRTSSGNDEARCVYRFLRARSRPSPDKVFIAATLRRRLPQTPVHNVTNL